ncbi:MAG: hypothetical protein ACETV1_04965 [Candidatus Bathyarchaeia archaeon]
MGIAMNYRNLAIVILCLAVLAFMTISTFVVWAWGLDLRLKYVMVIVNTAFALYFVMQIIKHRDID